MTRAADALASGGRRLLCVALAVAWAIPAVFKAAALARLRIDYLESHKLEVLAGVVVALSEFMIAVVLVSRLWRKTRIVAVVGAFGLLAWTVGSDLLARAGDAACGCFGDVFASTNVRVAYSFGLTVMGLELMRRTRPGAEPDAQCA